MIRRRVLATILAGIVAATCSPSTPTPSPREALRATPRPSESQAAGQPSPTPPPRPSHEPPDLSDPWDRITSTIERDGTIPLETALEAFALLVGPLPGVTPPAGPAPGISSGSAPIRWVLGHWDELTPAQQNAVQAALEPPATAGPGGARLAVSRVVAPGVAATCSPVKESRRQAEFEAKVEEAKTAIADRLGRPLKLPVEVRFIGLKPTPEGEEDKGQPAAETSPRDAACRTTAARPSTCLIEVTDRGEGLEGFELTHVITHETFHCFQYDIAKTGAEAGRVASWLAEGSAAWVGEVISGGSTVGQEYWENWVKYPWWPLFSRGYDGIGFFMHLQESGVDPWPLLARMLTEGARSSADAYAAVLKAGNANAMLDAWGPGYIRHETLQPDWSMGGPGFPAFVKTPVTQFALNNGDTAVAGVDPLGADANRINLQADVLVLQQVVGKPGNDHGLIRFADGRQLTLAEALAKPFCTKPGGCSCPADSAGAGHDWQTTSKGDVLLGVTGHTDGVYLWVNGFTVETTCAQAPEDFLPEEPCWCPPGPLGSLDRNRLARVSPASIMRQGTGVASG